MKARITSRTAIALHGWSFVLASILLSATSTAVAQGTADEWRGFYAGAGGNYANLSVERPGSYCDDCYYFDVPAYDKGDGDYAFVGHLGYRVGRYFAVEAAYRDGGTIGWSKNFVWIQDLGGFYHNDVEFSSKVPELSVVGILPFARRWEVYGRLGVGFWSADAEQTLVDAGTGEVVRRSSTDDGTGAVLGVGVGINLAKAWHARLEITEAFIDGDTLNVRSDTSVQWYSLELQYRFGARGAASQAPSTAK